MLLNTGLSGLPAIWKWLISLHFNAFLTNGGRLGTRRLNYHTHLRPYGEDPVSAYHPPLKMLFDSLLVSRQGGWGGTEARQKLLFSLFYALFTLNFSSGVLLLFF